MCIVQVQKTGNKFWDDCGAWSGSSGRHVCLDAQSMGEVRPLPTGLYGRQKRVDGTRVVVEINPQPSEVIQFRFTSCVVDLNGTTTISVELRIWKIVIVTLPSI